MTCPPKAFVAKLKTPYRYPVKNCHVFDNWNGVPSVVKVFPSVEYEKVAVLVADDPENAGVTSGEICSQISLVSEESVGPDAATLPVEEVAQEEVSARPL